MLEFDRILAIGSDHAGFDLKKQLIAEFSLKGIQFLDNGAYSADSVDYPDFARPVCQWVTGQGEGATGVLLCGSGNGMAMSANKVKGIRAALCWTPEIARLARLHNNANVLVLPARFLTTEEAAKIFHIFMITAFEGGRHVNRINKMEQLGDQSNI